MCCMWLACTKTTSSLDLRTQARLRSLYVAPIYCSARRSSFVCETSKLFLVLPLPPSLTVPCSPFPAPTPNPFIMHPPMEGAALVAGCTLLLPVQRAHSLSPVQRKSAGSNQSQLPLPLLPPHLLPLFLLKQGNVLHHHPHPSSTRTPLLIP